MRSILAALAIACAASWTSSRAAEPAPETPPAAAILQDGDEIVWHGGEVPLRPGPGWFALDVVGGLWHLLPATLKGEQAYDFIIDGSDGVHTGVRVHAAPPHALLYLRLPGLVAGKVDTPDIRFKDTLRSFVDDMSLPLTFKGRTWRFEVRDHVLSLTEGRTAMTFGQVVEPDALDDTLALMWAGDLDRDGRLDFIFEAGTNNSGEICVWLSSRAKPGEPAGKAACWLTTGC